MGEDELDGKLTEGEIGQAFIGMLKAHGAEDEEDGLPIVWMHVAVHRERKGVRRLGQGMHPGFAGRLRFREAVLEGDKAIRKWLAHKMGAPSAKAVVMAHAFNSGDPEEPSDEAMAAAAEWSID